MVNSLLGSATQIAGQWDWGDVEKHWAPPNAHAWLRKLSGTTCWSERTQALKPAQKAADDGLSPSIAEITKEDVSSGISEFGVKVHSVFECQLLGKLSARWHSFEEQPAWNSQQEWNETLPDSVSALVETQPGKGPLSPSKFDRGFPENSLHRLRSSLPRHLLARGAEFVPALRR